MKKIAPLLLIIFSGACAHSQVSNPQIVPVAVAPSGACSVTLPIQLLTPNGTLYTCQNGVWGQIGGSGGSLPSASLGQILSNTNGNTGYAGQGQIFYNQPGDTVASIESACSSLCTYVVTTPQTITLAANHTLASNVQLDFRAGGKWTVNGAFTLTIPGNVTGTLNQHFAGTSTIAFGPLQQYVPVEWFGAVGDGVTDDHVAIQSALNALTAGQAVLQARTYSVGTSTLTISKSEVGIKGISETLSELSSNSATADILDVSGVSSASTVINNKFEDFLIYRTVAGTGTSAGLSLNYTMQAVVNHVPSANSVRDYYIHGTGSNGRGVIQNCALSNSLGSGTYYGFYIDSTDGQQSPSLRLVDNFYFNGGSGTTYGLYSTGNAVNDLMSWNFETANATVGEAIVYTSGGSYFGASDIHFYGTINDSFATSGFLISGLLQPNSATVEISGGESTSTVTTSGKTIDIENSSSVSVIGHQMWGNSTYFVYINGNSFSNRIIGNQIGTFAKPISAHGVYINGATNANLIEGNALYATSATDGIALIGGTTNTVVLGNTLAGTYTNGITADSSAINNHGLALNAFQGTFTTPINDSGFNPLYVNTTLFGAISTAKTGACGAIAAGNTSLGDDGTMTWCSGTSFTNLWKFGLQSAPSVQSATYATNTNCSSAAAPAVCGSAASGSVVVAAAATTVTVNTTAVTANSQIQLAFDSSLGARLGVTCNTTPVQPTVSARTAGTSFTVTVPTAPTTNPACFSYTIVN